LFRFDGTQVQLASRTAVDMIPPAAVGEMPRAGTHAGAWIELRDRRGRPIFFQRLQDPFRTIAEHHSPDGKIEVFVRPPESGQFEVIVPALPDAATVAVISSPVGDARSTEPAREVARFDLRRYGQQTEQQP